MCSFMLNTCHAHTALRECEAAVEYFDIFLTAVHNIDDKISGQNEGENGPFKQRQNKMKQHK